MSGHKGIALGISFAVIMLVLCLPSQSYASWSFGISSGGHDGHHGWSGHGWGHHYYHPYIGLRVSLLPSNCYSVWSGGERFYYCDGYYYRRDRVDYIVVNPPATVLTTVPVTYQPVVVNGTTYYTNNGVYYIYTSSGYQVVQPPVNVQQAPVQQVYAQPAPAPVPDSNTQVTPVDDNTYTVSIPNDKGGYTSVVIKRTANGFVGPQGEFYASFPKVSQLKVMYATK